MLKKFKERQEKLKKYEDGERAAIRLEASGGSDDNPGYCCNY